MRRHWSGFTPKSKFTQHNCYYSCNLALHKPLWRTESTSLLLFSDGGTKPLHQTTLSLYCAFRNLHNFWTLYIEGTCHSITNCTESVALRQVLAPPWAAPLLNWTTRFIRLRSCLVRIFHLASFRVRFSICALPSIPHFIISCQTTASSCFNESCSIPEHCKGAPNSLQWFGKFFPFVSLYRFFAQALLDSSLSLSWWSFMCSSLLTRAAVTLSATLLGFSSKSWSCLSTFFSSTIFLGSSTQTIWSSGFSFSVSGCRKSFRQPCRILLRSP